MREDVSHGAIVKYDEGEVKATMFEFKTEEGVELKDMYNLIDCSMVEAVRLPENIDIWVDEEGLMKTGNVVIGYKVKSNSESEGFELQLAGSALLLSTDEEGNTIGLSNEQLAWIQGNVKVGLYGVVP